MQADPQLDIFLVLAEQLADVAASVVMKYFRQSFIIAQKQDMSPVSVADREAEADMRSLIKAAFPDHGIIGEEHGTLQGDAEYVWVLDPIDGTKSFVTGKPLFGTLVALSRGGIPILGIIDMPALKERWIGAENRPTIFNGGDVKTRPCAHLDDAWLYATSPQMFVGDDIGAFERLRVKTKNAVYGADCYAYGLLASGFVDVVCEASMQPYDFAALVPVVQGAGGIITDWSGNDLNLQANGRILATGDRHTHVDAIKVLAR